MSISELKSLQAQTRTAAESVWEKYQEAEAALKPIRDEWLKLYSEADRIQKKIELLEEIEREKNISVAEAA